MGIYDREYYRDDSRGAGFFSGVAPACKTIIGINVVVFLYFFTAPQSHLRDLLVCNSNAVFKDFQVWRLVTAAFLHSNDSLMHVGFNMLILWWLGRDVEAMYGAWEFARFYLTAAVLSSLAWCAVDRLTPDAGVHTAVGASGAVTAVVALYTMYYPKREVLLFFVLPVEMWVMLLIYIGGDALMMVQQVEGNGQGAQAGVGFAAHVGGALYGCLYKVYDLRWSHLLRGRRRPRLRVISPPPRERERTSAPTSGSRATASSGATTAKVAAVVSEEQLEARLDEVLAKIAREGGRSGLTEEEHQILEQASRRARDRRSDRP